MVFCVKRNKTKSSENIIIRVWTKHEKISCLNPYALFIVLFLSLTVKRRRIWSFLYKNNNNNKNFPFYVLRITFEVFENLFVCASNALLGALMPLLQIHFIWLSSFFHYFSSNLFHKTRWKESLLFLFPQWKMCSSVIQYSLKSFNDLTSLFYLFFWRTIQFYFLSSAWSTSFLLCSLLISLISFKSSFWWVVSLVWE